MIGWYMSRKKNSVWLIAVVVQSLSHFWLFEIPSSMPGFLSFTVSWSVLKLMSTELVKPCNHHILWCPLLLSSTFPSIRVFSNESALWIRWPKYWNFSFSISPCNECSGLLPFRIGWLDLLAFKGLSRVFSNTTVQKHQFFCVQPSLWSNSHNHTGLLEKT